jgi:hypothetical protein
VIITAVPEPSTYALLGLGALVMAVAARVKNPQRRLCKKTRAITGYRSPVFDG